MSLNTMRENFKHSAKWIMGFVTVAMIVTAFAGLGSNLRSVGPGPAANSPAPDDRIATVNGDPITRAEYEQAENDIRQSLGGRPVGAAQSAALHNFALDQLVAAKLQLRQAQKQGLTASDDEIRRARETNVAQGRLRETLGLPATASLSEVDAALSKAGSRSLEDLMPNDNLRQAVLLQKLQKSLAPMPTEQQVRDSFKQYHTRHILVDNKKRSDDQAKAQAQQMLAKARAPGADFAALAKQYSDDPGTKVKGGDDGWIDQSTSYVPEFKTAAFALPPGQITAEPVHVPQYGYFLIKLDAVRDNVPKDFDKDKARYISEFQDRQSREKGQALLDSLKKSPDTKIVILDPALRADRAVVEASQGDPAQRQAKLKAALTDYQAVLKKGGSYAQTGEINAQLASIYQELGQKPQAIAAYEAAVNATQDPNLRLTLGNLYLGQKNSKAAVEQFQAASKQAWDDQSLHTQLLLTYLQMKRQDLVAEEKKWMDDYKKRQQASQTLTMPPLSPGVSATGGQGIKIVPSSGKPAAPAPKPGQ